MDKLITKKQLLQKVLEFRTPQAIDIIALANHLGIQVFGKANNEKSAHIEYNAEDNTYKIMVNTNEPYTRQRFSIAHELSHFVLHNDELNDRGVLHRLPVRLSDPLEAQADTLAAEILMPANLVQEFISEQGIDITNITKDDVMSLAEHFQVSNFVAVMRLRELGHYVPFLDFA